MMNHSDKETSLRTEDVANTSDNNKVKSENSESGKDQYEYWAQTLSFPSYVIDSYKNKYPTTYAELRLDGLSKQQAARYIYRNCELYDGKMFDMNDTFNGPVYRSGFGFVRYLSD